MTIRSPFPRPAVRFPVHAAGKARDVQARPLLLGRYL
jgi:hypothetical protein